MISSTLKLLSMILLRNLPTLEQIYQLFMGTSETKTRSLKQLKIMVSLGQSMLEEWSMTDALLPTHLNISASIFVAQRCLLLDALGKCGVKMVVQASTRSVYGQRLDNKIKLDESSERRKSRPINPYGASKVGADERRIKISSSDPDTSSTAHTRSSDTDNLSCC